MKRTSVEFFPPFFSTHYRTTQKMKKIKLTRGLEALVDDEDFEYLNQWKWYALKSNKTHYAVRNYRFNGKHSLLRMHRIIMATPDNLVIDHKDRDGLNNQKGNLRNCTIIQNAINKGKKKGSSIYKGVDCYIDGLGYYHIRSRIRVNKKQVHLGFFKNEKDAAIAYNIAAIKFHGEFAIINDDIK